MSTPTSTRTSTRTSTATTVSRPSTSAARAVRVTKVYGEGDARSAPSTASPSTSSRPLHRHHGPVGLGQVHADALPRRARPSTSGEICIGDTDLTTLERQAADPAAPRPDRLRLPGVQPAADADGRGEHHAAAAARRPQARPRVARQSIVDTVGLADRLTHRPTRALRRPAAAGGRRPRPGQPAGDHLRRRADRQPRLPRRAPRSSASCAARSRARPDHRHGHPRPGRRGATPTGSLFLADGRHRRRDGSTRPPTRCSTA